MDTQDLDRLAFNGAELPAELSYYHTMYFLMMRALYQFARATGMSPEQGAREKLGVEAACKHYRLDGEMAAYQAEQLQATERARWAYRKARNAIGGTTALYLPPEVVSALAAADKIVEALDNVPLPPLPE